MRCLDLAEEPASDPSVAGAKAAGLARALAAGLPVLPGVVVPVHESRPVLDAGLAELEGRRSGRARLAAMRVQPDEQLLADLRVRLAALPPPYIVRSSSPLEANGTWSGAFSSLHGVGPDEIGTAVRGCWGSAFAVPVLDRASQTGTPPDQLGLAVLVQPEIDPDVGGIARLLSDGLVQIVATDGPLHPLMSGQVDGWRAAVAPDGTVTPATVPHRSLLSCVADLTRHVAGVLDHNLIEWAAVDGKVVLLQSTESPDGPAGGDPRTAGAVAARSDRALASPIALRVASLVLHYAGQLADELILPWAVGSAPIPSLPARSSRLPAPVAWAEARALAHRLTAQVWGGPPDAAVPSAERVLQRLRSGDHAVALTELAALPEPKPEDVAALLALLATVLDAAARRGAGAADVWRMTVDDLGVFLAGGDPPRAGRVGISRWEPYLHSVAMAAGARHAGVPAAPGIGAGRGHVLAQRGSRTAPPGRYVLIAAEPSPALGPLLWHAAGVVTRAGSPAAHVIEFARAIGVPAVVGCDLPDLRDDDNVLVGVDGAGTVSIVHLDRP